MNGEAISNLLKENGISQNELARRLKVSPAHMSNIVRGKRDAKVELLKEMCRQFGKEPRDLW